MYDMVVVAQQEIHTALAQSHDVNGDGRGATIQARHQLGGALQNVGINTEISAIAASRYQVCG